MICLIALFFTAYTQAAQTASVNVDTAIFQARTDQVLQGTSFNREAAFSVNQTTGGILVSLQVNGKQFLFTYGSISFKTKQLDSLQLLPDSPEQNKKTKADQLAFSALYRQLQPQLNQLSPLENGLLTSLDYLLNMIPINGSFSTINFKKAEAATLFQPQAFVNTCNQRGKAVSGSFDDFFKTYTQTKTVGNPASACLGRCGVGCVQSEPQLRKRQYTQQCFNHDLCVGQFGTTLGFCSDEFTAASDDYLNAPNCSFYVIGKWRQTFDWECNGAPVTVTISHFASQRFSTSTGLTGTWSVTGNKIVRTYDNGIKNNGTIAETNMKISGSMTNAQGRKGCFNDSYLTTQPL
ncbi:MAG: hypothetical protein IPN42_09765 [Methylococcaceae bacterium]|nr:hypothetical protein [Methylococcaceae bacterium]